MTLSDDELERFARHIVLHEIGGAGQAKLAEAHVVLAGAGGIGSPALQYLAAAGVARLTVIDDDDVDLSNLQRQTLFSDLDLGQSKAKCAAAVARRLRPGISAEARPLRIDGSNARALVAGADVVVDGTDNFDARLAIADACLAERIPLVSSAAIGFEGQLGTFRGWEADKPCYRCFVGSDPGRDEMSCADRGVLGALTGVMGSLAALEAIRAITGFGEDSAGKLLLFDALSLRFRTLALPKDPGCDCAAACNPPSHS